MNQRGSLLSVLLHQTIAKTDQTNILTSENNNIIEKTISSTNEDGSNLNLANTDNNTSLITSKQAENKELKFF